MKWDVYLQSDVTSKVTFLTTAEGQATDMIRIGKEMTTGSRGPNDSIMVVPHGRTPSVDPDFRKAFVRYTTGVGTCSKEKLKQVYAGFLEAGNAGLAADRKERKFNL